MENYEKVHVQFLVGYAKPARADFKYFNPCPKNEIHHHRSLQINSVMIWT